MPMCWWGGFYLEDFGIWLFMVKSSCVQVLVMTWSFGSMGWTGNFGFHAAGSPSSLLCTCFGCMTYSFGLSCGSVVVSEKQQLSVSLAGCIVTNPLQPAHTLKHKYAQVHRAGASRERGLPETRHPHPQKCQAPCLFFPCPPLSAV